jgi:spectrin alpha
LQRKFDEFQKDMTSQEYRVTEVNDLASKLVLEGHPERETILKKKEVNKQLNCLTFIYIHIHLNVYI